MDAMYVYLDANQARHVFTLANCQEFLPVSQGAESIMLQGLSEDFNWAVYGLEIKTKMQMVNHDTDDRYTADIWVSVPHSAVITILHRPLNEQEEEEYVKLYPAVERSRTIGFEAPPEKLK